MFRQTPVTKENLTDVEKLQQYINWQTSRIKSNIQTDVGQEAYLSLLKLNELGLAKIEPTSVPDLKQEDKTE
jgi:hypothetical protein